MKPLTKADRVLLEGLVAALGVPDWQWRRDDRGPRFIAGSRGTVRPIDGRLVVTLRPAAAAEVEGLRRRLIRAGILDVEGEALIVACLPDDAEAAEVRGLLGLHRTGPRERALMGAQ